MNVKKGDNVIVITGKDKGQKGTVTRVFPAANRVIVGGVNKAKRHMKGKGKEKKGQIVEVEASLHASNVKLVDAPKKKASKASK